AKKKPSRGRPFDFFTKSYFEFTEFSNSAPPLNFTTFLAAILIVLPVCGLRPSLAALLETDHDPKPTRETRPPFFRVPLTLFRNDSNASFAALLLIPASAAIASINSDLFMIISINCWLNFVNEKQI